MKVHHTEKKEFKDSSLRPKTIKFIEENTEKKLHDTIHGNVFLGMTPKAWTTKVKIDK